MKKPEKSSKEKEVPVKEQPSRYPFPPLPLSSLRYLSPIPEGLAYLEKFAPQRLTISSELLSAQINDLRDELLKRSTELKKQRKESQKWKNEAKKIKQLQLELANKEQLGFVLKRIGEKPGQVLLKSKSFQDKFLGADPCNAYVMSVDIRRSTELMLKARTPQLYAQFITELSRNWVRQLLNITVFMTSLLATVFSRFSLISTVVPMQDIML